MKIGNEFTEIIDCNVMIGKQTAPHRAAPKDSAEIISILQQSGITGAMVYHSYALEYHPLEGNYKLLEEVNNHAMLMPVWVIIPGNTVEFLSPDELGQEISKYEIKGLRLFPHQSFHNFSLAEWSMAAMYRLAEEMQIPLFLDMDQTDWNTIDEMLLHHPDLILVLTKISYRYTRYFYPLLKKFNRLYLEISFYKNHLGIEYLTKEFGADRLIFGTGMPSFSPGGALGLIYFSSLAAEEREKILFKNIQGLLEGIKYE